MGQTTGIKVSVCIPVYGTEKYIGHCARSLFEQTMQDGIEFIFVNDCTKDKSMEILNRVLQEYPARMKQVQIINLSQNSGLPAARKTAIHVARGEFLIHCDSDDWVEPDMYEKLYNKAVRDHADMVACRHYEYDGNVQKTNRMFFYSDYIS